LNKAWSSEIASAYAKIHHGARDPDFYGLKWFKRLNEIKKNARIESYGHVDLFLCLHASFKCLPPEYHAGINHTRSVKPNFVQSQLDLAYEHLLKFRPKIIIAVYKSAAEIFLRYHASILDCKRQCLNKGQLVEKFDLEFDGRKITFITCSNLPNHRLINEANEMAKIIVDEIRQACFGEKI
jgi:hypothetical protein